MGDRLSVRIVYRLKFVDDPVSHRLLVEAREELMRLDGSDGELEPSVVYEWTQTRGLNLVPWQIKWFKDAGVKVE